MRCLSAVVVGLLGGCFHPTAPLGAPCNDTEPCPSGQVCVAGACGTGAVVDGVPPRDAVDSPPDTCSGPVCQGNILMGCGAPITCDDGCVTNGGAHCGAIVPSNGVTWGDVPSPGGVLDLTDTYQLDTTSGTLSVGIIPVVLPAGVTLDAIGSYRVLALGSFVMASGASLHVTGDRPLIILASGDVSLGTGAVIDLGGGCTQASDPTCGGPGGGTGTAAFNVPATGCGPGQSGGDNEFGADEAGGGGGGAGTSGGDGGGTLSRQGIPGLACGTSTLVPLIGGSGGGAGGVNTFAITGGRGGGGGGAIQITARHALVSAATITAGGSGGETGHPQNPGGGGGGGGGAGGGILLEGKSVTLVNGSIVAANGGGGGGNAVGGGRGESGHASASCAAGGSAGTHNDGGDGGCSASLPGDGSVAVTLDRGGGGGAVGWIHLRTVTQLVGGIQSPTPTTEAATVQ